MLILRAFDQVNHLGTALLSLLLLGPLKATATSKGTRTRLTIVSSENHFWVKFDEVDAPNTLERMDTEESFRKGMSRYNASKLLNILWMRELSAKAGDNVIINAVNPGFCQSSLHRTDSSGTSFSRLIGWTAEQGGHCLTDAATQHLDDGHGGYISEQTVKRYDRPTLSLFLAYDTHLILAPLHLCFRLRGRPHRRRSGMKHFSC